MEGENPPHDSANPPDSDWEQESDGSDQLESDRVQSTFEQIIAEVKAKKWQLNKTADRADFLRQYHSALRESTSTDQSNILHFIAYKIGNSHLTRCIAREKDLSFLLGQQDASGRTPLHVALTKKNSGFLSAIPKCFSEAGELDKRLQDRADHGRNCIHATIYHGVDETITVEFIQNASAETLRARDANGFTPLHLAVDFVRSSAAQLRIALALLGRDDGALDGDGDRKPSVYQYHQQTLAKGKQDLAELQTQYSMELNEDQIGIPEGENSAQSRDQFWLQTGRAPREPNTGEPRLQLTAATKTRLPPQHSQHRVMYDGARRPPAGTGGGGEPISARVRNRDTLCKQIRALQEKIDRAEEIGHAVKLSYLRSTFEGRSTGKARDQFSASQFLYAANVENIELYFDLSKGPRSISKESFEQSYGHIRFDQILRYVSFGRLELQKRPQPVPKSRFARVLSEALSTGQGRDDLTFFFGWLYRKNVRHILRVIVDDMEHPPHSDKALEECLKDFKIDFLDWRKLDLCPQTLSNACPAVQEVVLYWGGNRAVLRAWSEPQGLPNLQLLKRIHVVWNAGQMLEYAEVIKTYLQDFKRRLQKSIEGLNAQRKDSRDMIDVVLCSGGSAGNQLLHQQASNAKAVINGNERNLQSNRWLDSMDRFVDELQNIRIPETTQKYLAKDLKVALIDDGVDIHVESLRGKVAGGDTFDRSYLDANGPSPYYHSSRGHGTVMADMICRMCPMARLYVYKLETYPDLVNNQGKDQISAESAAAAVGAAVKQGVDIISMSWTICKTKENQKGINDLDNAVRSALDAKILLFCAASDSGAMTGTEYPWAIDPTRIFKIGAATADGRPWERTGDPQSLTFIVPGHKVVSRNPHHESAIPRDFEENTGSSVATALAAGLTALVLHCIRLGAIQAENEMQQEGQVSPTAIRPAQFQIVKDPDSMRNVLRRIGLDSTTHKFIEVWNHFDGPTESLKSGKTAKLGVIARLARDLISGATDGQ
ncbi:S8 family peptidase [Aspergillus lucknowensis]|uniref:Peptidase S8/S53 domain-containing protein n=1 Tax=Aspergillus lucknowensis TaxID=176173 RepID=A0ABR4M485_9EURO